MKFIGITGGVGAGKTRILEYLAQKPETKVLLADEIAHRLMEPGTLCYGNILRAFPEEDILQTGDAVAHGQQPFDRNKLAKVIFQDERKREIINNIVHPAVKAYVTEQAKKEKEAGTTKLLVLEAALLIEEKYNEICDELWYIYTSEENRRERLKLSRGYSDEKINRIMESQLGEEEYRKATAVTIDNNGSPEETFRQIEQALRRR